MEPDTKTCPRCAEDIKAAALVCRHCGLELKMWPGTPESVAAGRKIVICILGGLALLFVIGLIVGPWPNASRPGAAAADAAAPAPSAEDAAAERSRLAEQAEDRRRGFHCLSSWDGSNADVVRQVKRALRDPGSFEHDETTIGPVTEKGRHPLRMRYRARNGFGGMNVEEVAAAVDPDTCKVTIIESPAQIDALLGNGYAVAE